MISNLIAWLICPVIGYMDSCCVVFRVSLCDRHPHLREKEDIRDNLFDLPEICHRPNLPPTNRILLLKLCLLPKWN